MEIAGGVRQGGVAHVGGDPLQGLGLGFHGADRLFRIALGGEHRAAGREHALGDAVVIAQVDEQQAAMVAFGMHPAGQSGGLAGVGGAQGGTGVGAIGVHLGHMSWHWAWAGTQAPAG